MIPRRAEYDAVGNLIQVMEAVEAFRSPLGPAGSLRRYAVDSGPSDFPLRTVQQFEVLTNNGSVSNAPKSSMCIGHKVYVENVDLSGVPLGGWKPNTASTFTLRGVDLRGANLSGWTSLL